MAEPHQSPQVRLQQLLHRLQPAQLQRQQRPQPGSAKTLPSGLQKEGSGASRPSPPNRRGVDAKVCPRLMMLKLRRFWASLSPKLLQRRRPQLRRSRSLQSRRVQSALKSQSGLRKEGSGVSRPSRLSKPGAAARVCPRSTKQKLPRCLASKQPLQRLRLPPPQPLPLPGRRLQRQLRLRLLRLLLAVANPQVTSAHRQLEHQGQLRPEAWHQSVPKTVKLINSAAD